MSKYIQYDSPEWKRISQCLVSIGIYGTEQCNLNNKTYIASFYGKPALVDNYEGCSAKTDEAVALLREKHPEYRWERYIATVIHGVLL